MPVADVNIAITDGSANEFNLIGNPYPSYIPLNSAADGINNLLDINTAQLSENTIWFWDQSLNGGIGGYYNTAAGSGGSIFLAAMKVCGSGTLRARGCQGERWAYGRSGGGRIAIWHHLSLAEIERRISERNTLGLHHRETSSAFDGELDVSAYDALATPGTKGFYCFGGTVFLLK